MAKFKPNDILLVEFNNSSKNRINTAIFKVLGVKDDRYILEILNWYHPPIDTYKKGYKSDWYNTIIDECGAILNIKNLELYISLYF